MTRATNFALHTAHVALLRGASLIVPFPQRVEWYREWTSELCHVRLACMPVRFSWIAALELTAFCLGSFQDALCLRRLNAQAHVSSASVHGSAPQCLLWLFTVLAGCAIIAQLLPGVQSEQDAARNQLRPGVLLLEQAQDDDHLDPAISFAQFRDWESHRQRFFTDLAFYRTEHAAAGVEEPDHRGWVIAHTTPNLFRVLGVELARVSPDAGADPEVPRAILSQSRWRRDFDSNPAVVGEVVPLAHRHVKIIAIAPESAWRLPGNPDLWILESTAKMARESRHKAGYVIAQLSPDGQEMASGDSTLISSFDSGDLVTLRGVTFATAAGIFPIYLFSLFLAVLALPAVTTVFKSESSFASHRPSLASRVRCSIFLLSKFALVAAIGYFAALDLAYCGFDEYSTSAEFLQLLSSFALCLFGLRWVLADQSRRCPLCLRCVSHPARVGFASCSFLAWNGTEMICTGGHALLHVPSLPTSWFSHQRWIYLDTSWDFLFADHIG